MKKILVTGGCGFIGSHFVHQEISCGNFIVNLDKLTYAANQANLDNIKDHKNYRFFKGDINDSKLVSKLLEEFEIDWLVNFAAESHVDNSIKGPEVFIVTNINGTYSLLNESLKYFNNLESQKKENFRFLHVSTDEVFGSLKEDDAKFSENSKYQPNSPYSASKAASDHLVRAWNETYKLPTIITNCSNNFGPNQHNEKLIPTIIRTALSGLDIPIYGNGKNIRDWIYVKDHCEGIALALNKGKTSETYLFGGENEIRNIEIAKIICKILDELQPKKDGSSYQTQIKFVTDRLGHDYRYAIDNKKSFETLGFKVTKSFEERLKETVIHKLNERKN